MKQDVTLVLQKKAEQVRYATEILLQQTQDWQTIQEFLSNRVQEIELNDRQKGKLKRYQYIYDQLSSGKYTDTEVRSQISKIFLISSSQAYEDINCAREIFNSVININKQFELKMELQSARDLKRKCAEIGDYKNAFQAQKCIIEILKTLPDEETNAGELFKDHHWEVTFDPALLGAPPVNMLEVLAALNAKRNKKINLDMFEELSFTEEDAKQ